MQRKFWGKNILFFTISEQTMCSEKSHDENEIFFVCSLSLSSVSCPSYVQSVAATKRDREHDQVNFDLRKRELVFFNQEMFVMWLLLYFYRHTNTHQHIFSWVNTQYCTPLCASIWCTTPGFCT